MVNIAIVDDSKKDSELLQSFLETFKKETNTNLYYDSYDDGLKFLENYHLNYDVILLDIEMPLVNGVEVARKIRNKDPFVSIIFITSLRQYVLKGYEVNALDYIIKPIEYNIFKVKFQKAIDISNKYVERKIKFKIGQEHRYVDIMDILYIEVTGSYLTVYTTNTSFKIKGPLYVIADQLGDTHFAMCNSCYLVNMNYVEKFDRETVTVAGHELLFSRGKRKTFLERLDSYLGSLK